MSNRLSKREKKGKGVSKYHLTRREILVKKAKAIAKELVKKFEEMGRNGELKDIFQGLADVAENNQREERRRRLFDRDRKIGPLAYHV